MAPAGGPAGFLSGPHAGHPVPVSGAPDVHVAVLKAQLDVAARMRNVSKVNAHSGRDFFSARQGDELHAALAALPPMLHETHRGRLLYSPWVTRDFLARNPSTRLTADYSHFTCVAEAVNDEHLEAAIGACLPRVDHIHARVGFEEGPQVGDPRAPEFADALARHEQWWEAVWDAQAKRGDAVSTLTPEHGPPPYQWTIPGGVPMANIDEVNHWLAVRLSKKFEAKFGAGSATILQP